MVTAIKNKWYVLSIRDKTAKYGFKPAQGKGDYYTDLEKAIEQKEWLEEMREIKIYVLERTCEVIL